MAQTKNFYYNLTSKIYILTPDFFKISKWPPTFPIFFQIGPKFEFLNFHFYRFIKCGILQLSDQVKKFNKYKKRMKTLSWNNG